MFLSNVRSATLKDEMQNKHVPYLKEKKLWIQSCINITMTKPGCTDVFNYLTKREIHSKEKEGIVCVLQRGVRQRTGWTAQRLHTVVFSGVTHSDNSVLVSKSSQLKSSTRLSRFDRRKQMSQKSPSAIHLTYSSSPADQLSVQNFVVYSQG